MKSNNNRYNERIARLLNNELTDRQRKKLNDWVQASDEHKRQLIETVHLWKAMKKYHHTEQAYHADKAWEHVKQNITAGERKKKIKTRRMTGYASIAAILVLGLFILIRPSGKYEKIQVGDRESIRQIELTDGSQVSINAGSSLSYPKEFSKSRREVTLTGEAFFEVANKTTRPFLVKTRDVTILVTGTSFNVHAYPNHSLEVTVSGGQVSVVHKQYPSVDLQQGEKAILTDQGWIKKINDNINYLAWMTKKFTFKNAELEEVTKQIESVYHCQIKFAEPALKKCRFTAIFDNQELDDIIQSICLAFNIKAEQNNDTYILSGQACK